MAVNSPNRVRRNNDNRENPMNTVLTAQASNRVREILVEQLGVARTQITPETDIKADLGADSLDVVEIGMAIEEDLNVSLPEEAMDQVQTVEELEAVIAGLIDEAQKAC
jgi:acyl carrier protein